MEINTQNSSENINENAIHFPNGLLGFENLKNFHLVSSDTEKDLHWLQPEGDSQIEFAVTLPSVFQVNYEVNLTDDEEKTLEIEDNDEIVVLVTLSKNQKENTDNSHLNANFMGPIIINVPKKLGLQKVMNHNENPVTITMRG